MRRIDFGHDDAAGDLAASMREARPAIVAALDGAALNSAPIEQRVRSRRDEHIDMIDGCREILTDAHIRSPLDARFDLFVMEGLQ